MENSDIRFQELPARDGVIGQIILSRGAALNALTLSMLSQLQQQLSIWQQQENCHAVIIKSDSQRAFCAGGDIRTLYEGRNQNMGDAHPYFSVEYSLNKFLYHFDKPYIALLDGITMGGGVGISIHGSHRVATENCLWAMPESKIGFFPDVGASYYLSRAPEMMGWYLALSGHSVDAGIAYDLGLVNYVVSSSQLEDIERALCEVEFTSDLHETVDQVLTEFHQIPEASELVEYYPLIRRCFSQCSVEAVMQSLQFEDTAWSDALVKDLLARSPFSLELIFEQLYRAGSMDFDEVMQQDLTLVQHFVRGHDLYEGIRAMLIDKDQQPQWQPATLSEVDHDKVQAYFTPLSQAVRLS